MPALTLKYNNLSNLALKDNKDNKNGNQQQAFIVKKNKEVVEPFEITKIVGISTAIIFFLLFLYIYISANYKGYLTRKNFTMSVAFKYCEKRISIILIILSLCMFQFYFDKQNLYSNDFRRNSIPITSYIITTALLLLFFVWPEEYNLHAIVALFILLAIAYITLSIQSIYKDYYEESGLIGLDVTSYIVISLFLLTLVVGFFNFILYRFKIYSVPFIVLFGTLEIMVIVGFCIFIGICSTLPPLPNQGDLVCFYNK